MPGYVLHHGGVTRENGFGVDNFVFGGGVDVPQADGVVIAVQGQGVATNSIFLCLLFSQLMVSLIKAVQHAVLHPFRQNFLTSGARRLAPLLGSS